MGRIKLLVMAGTLVVSIGLGFSVTNAGAEQVVPTTTIPTAPLPTVPTVAPGGTATTQPLDMSSPPIYATCEEATREPTNDEPCGSLTQDFFDFWGGKLGLLQSQEVRNQVGAWALSQADTWLVNYAALWACGEMWLDNSELAFYEVVEGVDGPDVNDDEMLFDVAMRYICPDLAYQRQLDWDTYVPYTDPSEVTTPPAGGGTTSLPGPTTTLPSAIPSTTLPPVQGPTTTLPSAIPSTTLPPVQGPTTTLAATASSTMSLNGVVYNCTQLHDTAVTPPSTCDSIDPFMTTLFNNIVQTNPNSFQAFADLTTLGNFSALPNMNDEARAWAGFEACYFRSEPPDPAGFEQYATGVWTGTTPADAQLVYAEAQRVLCPFIP